MRAIFLHRRLGLVSLQLLIELKQPLALLLVGIDLHLLRPLLGQLLRVKQVRGSCGARQFDCLLDAELAECGHLLGLHVAVELLLVQESLNFLLQVGWWMLFAF